MVELIVRKCKFCDKEFKSMWVKQVDFQEQTHNMYVHKKMGVRDDK